MSQKRREKELRRRKRLARRREPRVPAGAIYAAMAEGMVEEWCFGREVEEPPEDLVPRLEVPTTSLIGYGIPHWDLCMLLEAAGEQAAQNAAAEVSVPDDDGRIQLLWSPSKQRAYLEPGVATVWTNADGQTYLSLVMPDGRTVLREEVVA